MQPEHPLRQVDSQNRYRHPSTLLVSAPPACRFGTERLLAVGLVASALLAGAPSIGASPLGDAAKAGDLERVRQFIDEGAELNAQSGFGRPLHWAILNGHDEVAALLVARGADVDAATTLLGAPLHAAAAKGSIVMARLLLEHGANPDAQRQNGFTPLHVAAERGAVGVLRALLEHGADVNALSRIMNDGGLSGEAQLSPLHMAEAGDHAAAAQMLRDAGAAPPPAVEPIGPLMVSASAERGKELLLSGFHCALCHPVDPGVQRAHGGGPTLRGVVGRPVASLPDFDYSRALRRLGGIWNEERLYAFISHPIAMVPGTKMDWQARGEPQQRADLIAYLRTLADAPQ